MAGFEVSTEDDELLARVAQLEQQQQQQQQQQQHLLLQSLQAGFVLHAPDGTLQFGNIEAARLLGLSMEQLQGKTLIDPAWRFVREDGSKLPLEEYPVAQVLASLRPLKQMILGVDRPPTGDRVWVSVRGYPEFSPRRELTRVIVLFHDITDRRKAEAKLRANEALLNETGRLARVGGWEFNSATLHLRWTDEVYRIHEVDPSIFEPTVSGAIDFYAPESQPIIKRAIQRAIEHGEPFDVELEIITARGHRRWVHAVGRAKDEQPGGRTVSGVFQDITERKQTEQALRKSEERFRRVIDTTGEYIYEVDEQGRITFLSDRVTAVLGYAPDELLGKTPFETMDSAEEVERVRAIFIGHVENRRPFRSMEHLCRTKGGQLRTLSITGMPLLDAAGSLIGYQGAVEDITDRKQAEHALRQSEQRYRTMFEHAIDGIFQSTAEGRALAANSAFVQMLGYESEAEVLTTLVDLPRGLWVRPEERAIVRQLIEAHGYVRGYECEFLRKDGTKIWISLNATVAHGGDEPARYFHGSIRDITDSKRVAEATRAEAERLRQVLEATSGGVWDWNIPSGDAVFSPRYSSMLGYTPEEFAKAYKDWKSLVHPDDFECVHQLHLDHFHRNKEFSIEFRMREKLGAWHWVHSRALVIERDRQGNPVRMIGTHTDIQERKRAEEALRESEYRRRAAIEGAGDGLWDWNVPESTVFFTRRWKEMLGFAEDEIGNGLDEWSDRIHPDDLATVMTEVEAHLAGTTPLYSNEHRVSCKDGSWKWILDRGVVVSRDPADKPLRMIGTHTDITERKQAEEERAKLEAQLQQAQKMESVGRLAGGVAHDFNNMLAVILGNAELALQQVDPEQPLHADLEDIRTAARRSADLTRQLLAFARKQTVAPRVIDLNETVAGMLKMLHRIIGEDISLSLVRHANLWPVNVDPSQVDQILANLCVNARDSITGIGKLTIETDNQTLDQDYCAIHAGFVPGDYVKLAVSDDGCGMDKETVAQIFEPFFTTKEVGKGTGLGLASVYGAVKQNGGFIKVYSEPGQGSTFSIYLPRHAGQGERARANGTVAPVRGHETILLVEDEPGILKTTTRLLERMGYIVIAAVSPGEAIHLAKEHAGDIHLLLTDVVMPEMNGRDLAKNILSFHPQVKRLFMSGYTANVIAHQGVLDKGVAFIQKPFSSGDLAAKVREVLDDTTGT